MTHPDRVYWCDGTVAERQMLLEQGVRDGVFIQLNQEKLPGCYLHRSNPNDVARSEHLTFICTPSQDMAGPTNNWMETRAGYAKLRPLFDGCMKGRTMYVVPFVMGPIGRRWRRSACEITDSLYVAVSMGIMTRMGDVAWKQLGQSRRVHPLPALRRRRQPRSPLHLPFPAGQHDLELRLAATAATRCWEEMPGPAHRQLPRPAAGVDGRAHAADGRDRRRRARRPTSPPPSPAPAARPISRC